MESEQNKKGSEYSLDLDQEMTQGKAMRLFLEYHHFVEMVAFRLAPLPDLQGDIVQEVFIDFIKKADHWKYE